MCALLWVESAGTWRPRSPCMASESAAFPFQRPFIWRQESAIQQQMRRMFSNIQWREGFCGGQILTTGVEMACSKLSAIWKQLLDSRKRALQPRCSFTPQQPAYIHACRRAWHCACECGRAVLQRCPYAYKTICAKQVCEGVKLWTV